jgi:hypothetical protein
MRTSKLTLAMGLIILLASCGRATSLTSDGAAQSTSTTTGQAVPANVSYVGPITSSATYDGGSISLSVPSSSDQPTASWQSTYANCASGDAICDPAYPMSISLARVTDLQSGTAVPGGSISATLDNTLAYVFSQHNVPCSPVGPPASSVTTNAAGYECTILNFVDASSGSVLYSVQGPNL